MGESGWGLLVERGGVGGWGGFWGLEWASFSAASIAVCTRPAVDSQLLHQNNKRRPHKGRSWAGRWQQTLPPVLLHWAHFSTVATETEPFVSLASFPSSFHHSAISSTCSPVSLPRPSSILLLSPASLEQISSCLSLARSKYTSTQATIQATVQRWQTFIWLLIQRS